MSSLPSLPRFPGGIAGPTARPLSTLSDSLAVSIARTARAPLPHVLKLCFMLFLPAR